MMNRIFRCAVAIIMAALLTAGAVPVSYAADTLDWNLENGVLSLTGTGEMEDFAVSYAPWYDDRAAVKSVVISDGITSISSNAFYDCDSLEAVELPESLVRIGNEAFGDCDVLASISIPGNVTYIGDGSFYATALESVNVPASVTYIGNNAFGWCAELNGINVEQGNGAYSSDEAGVLFNAGKTLLIKFPANNGQTCYEIPGTVDSIESYAFENSINLETVIIPEAVESMGEGAFFNSSIKSFSVDAANGVYSSEYGVLFDKNKTVLIQYPACSEEETYTVPSGVTEIADGAFHNSINLRSIVISDGMEALGDESFFYCEGLEYVHIPSSVTQIGADIIDNTSAYICSGSDDSYAKTYAEENGIDFIACSGHGVNGIEISESKIEIENKNTYLLTATVLPEESTDKTVIWTSDNESVATVEDGAVTAVSVGTANITAVADGFSASCEVTVTPRIFSITWIVDGVETVDYVEEGAEILAPAVPEKEGHSFAFWSPDVPEFMPENDLKFTAVWTVEGYKAVFDANGGKWTDGSEIKNIYFLYESEITAPEAPEKEGCTFVGWTPEIPDAMPAEALEFAAIWSANSYDAVFDANGGSWADGDCAKTVSAVYGLQISAPDSPIKAGYTFTGWTPEVGLMDSVNGKSYSANWVAMTNITYTVETYTMGTDGEYAVESKEYKGTTDETVTVEYESLEGLAFNPDKSVLSGVVSADGSLVLKVYYDRIKNTVIINGVTGEYYYGAMLDEPEMPEAPAGYEQNGWVDGEGNPVIFPLEIDADVPGQINPCFVKCIYTVKWNVDGSITEEKYEFDSAIVKPSVPEKKGYIFKGWTPEIPDNMPANDLEFTALFEKIIYTCECGEKFDDEDAYNAHIAYEKALKATRISIKNNPGTKKINYGETLRLTAVVTSELNDIRVYWYVDGEKAGEGETFEIAFNNGEKTVTAKAVDSDGNVLLDSNGNEICDGQKVTVDSGIWQKIVSFFKNLFRINRTVIQKFFVK